MDDRFYGVEFIIQNLLYGGGPFGCIPVDNTKLFMLYDKLLMFLNFLHKEDDGGNFCYVPSIVKKILDKILEFNIVVQIINHIYSISFVVISN